MRSVDGIVASAIDQPPWFGWLAVSGVQVFVSLGRHVYLGLDNLAACQIYLKPSLIVGEV